MFATPFPLTDPTGGGSCGRFSKSYYERWWEWETSAAENDGRNQSNPSPASKAAKVCQWLDGKVAKLSQGIHRSQQRRLGWRHT